jgi:ribosomal-protein-alanine N-acetyltransferase
MTPEIVTDILKLKLPEIADAEKLFQLRTHPDVTKLIKRQRPNDVAEVVQFIKNINADLGKAIFFCIHMLESNELAGTIGLKRIDTERGYAEVGYELFPQYRQKGIMSNALKAVLFFASEQLNIQYIEAYTHKDNLASRKLLSKLGFEVVKDITDPDNLNNVIYGRRLSTDFIM